MGVFFCYFASILEIIDNYPPYPNQPFASYPIPGNIDRTR